MTNTLSAGQGVIDTSVLDALFETQIKESPFTEPSHPTPVFTSPTIKNEAMFDAVVQQQDDNNTPVAVPLTEKAIDSALDQISTQINTDDTTQPVETVTENIGRPKTDKDSLVGYLQQKIAANEFGIPEDAPYDKTKGDIKDYLGSLSEKELYNLLETNYKVKEDEIRAEYPKELFESLPPELQYLASYHYNGGTDLKPVLKAMLQSEEIRSLDVENEMDQEHIIRDYLNNTGWKEAAINEQLEEWKEGGKLEKKAREFKPSLDQMQQGQLDAYVRNQAAIQQREQELANFYAQNVYQQLESNQIAGIKVDKRFARELENGLLTLVEGPFSGKPVNALGYALEKVQYIEPDYEAVVMATWLLNDKKGFLEAMGTLKANEAVDKTAKLIKMNQGIGVSEQPIEQKPAVKRLPNTSNMFKRQKV